MYEYCGTYSAREPAASPYLNMYYTYWTGMGRGPRWRALGLASSTATDTTIHNIQPHNSSCCHNSRDFIDLTGDDYGELLDNPAQIISEVEMCGIIIWMV